MHMGSCLHKRLILGFTYRRELEICRASSSASYGSSPRIDRASRRVIVRRAAGMGPTLCKDQLDIDTWSVQRTSGGPGAHTATLKVLYLPTEPQLSPIGIYEHLLQKLGRSRHAPHATAEHHLTIYWHFRAHRRLTAASTQSVRVSP